MCRQYRTKKEGGLPLRPDSRPRVLLADDYAAILTALKLLLEPSCEVVGEVTDGVELLEAARRFHPDVSVVDLSLPEIDGLEACRQLEAAAPHTTVIVFSADDDPAIQRRAFEVGASAFVAKYRAGDDLLPAIHKAFLEERAPIGYFDMRVRHQSRSTGAYKTEA